MRDTRSEWVGETVAQWGWIDIAIFVAVLVGAAALAL